MQRGSRCASGKLAQRLVTKLGGAGHGNYVCCCPECSCINLWEGDWFRRARCQRDSLRSAKEDGEDLLIQTRDSALGAVQAQVKRRRRAGPNCQDVRAERAHRLTQLSELSAAKQALEGDPPAPGNHATLQLLRDPERRPAAPRGRLAPELAGTSARQPLEKDRLLTNLRSARREQQGGIRDDG